MPAQRRDVEDQLLALERMKLAELREFWSDRWGFAPRLRSTELLRHMIAWRLQAAIEGGLDAETLSLLRRKSTPQAPMPPVGSRLTREYRGELYEVEIRRNGVTYGGRVYGSLSEVASVITGMHWNGPRFFGLRARAQP